MKKICLPLLLSALLFVAGLAACDARGTESGQTQEDKTSSDSSLTEVDGGFSSHSRGNWETVYSPDCVRNGLKIRRCADCGASCAEIIPARGHVCNEERFNQSMHYCVCDRCGEEYGAAEHTFSAEAVCTGCGYVLDYTLGLEYAKTDDGKAYRVTGDADIGGSVLTVPATYKGLPVTEVGDYAFAQNEADKIVLPDSILKIGVQAFKGAAASEIILPRYMETLGDGAFGSCYNLRRITLPDGLKRIGNSTFYACMSLRGIVIPDSVVEIGYQAFDHCYTLTGITLGKNVESIENAFLQCDRLLEVYNRSVLPVAADGTMKFGGVARNAENVYTTGNGHSNFFATQDGIFCYEGEDRVILLDYNGDGKTLTVPDTLKGKPCILAEHSFYGAESVESLRVSGGIADIPDFCFTKMTALTEVTFAEGVTNVGSSCFSGGALTDVVIPASLVSIAGDTFGKKLTNVDISADNPVYLWSGNCLIDKQTKTLVLGNAASVIPSDGSVEIIGEHAFSYLPDLQTEIPSCIRTIGVRAFFNSGLSEIRLPEGVETVDAEAFACCAGLSQVYIPSSAKTVCVSAFYDSPVESIRIAKPDGWIIKKNSVDEGIAADADRLADVETAAQYFKETESLADMYARAAWVQTA